jgi:hypothetical protein
MADSKISALTTKATPIGADLTNILDSAASNADKKVTLSSLPLSNATVAFVGNGLVDIATIASGTTTSSITHIDTGLEYLLEANKRYQFEFIVQHGCNGVGGLKYLVSTPAGSDLRAKILSTTSGVTALTSNIMTTNVETAININTVSSQSGWAEIKGIVQNGATPGLMKLQFRSIVALQVSSFYKESYLLIKEI